MTWLKLAPAWCWWTLALVVVAGGQQIRVLSAQSVASEARAELADYRTEIAERDRRGALAVLAENQRRQKAADENRREALEQIEQAKADAAAASATADGLRGETERLKRKLASCAGTATGGAPGRDAGSVLADLLAEVESEGRAMAEEAQRRGIAGSACERNYDGVRGE